MSVWAALTIVLLVGAMTYAMRAVAIVALAEREIPFAFQRALKSVGPAVLAALTINLAAGGDGGPSLDVAEAAALVAGGLVAVWRKNVLWTLIAGMTTLWVLSALL
jgi:branched-subunit amino acid transport protein